VPDPTTPVGRQPPPTITGPLLSIRDLSVAYATETEPVVAVDRVDLDVAGGEFLAVVGESGCGKSTLLYAIAQLLSPPAAITGGSVRFNGTEMVELSEKQLRRVRWRDLSVVMQSAMNALNPVMTVAQQMRDACRAHSQMSDEEIEARSAEALRLVSIDPVHLRSYPHQLSGGMRQRAMIAMALLFSPQLVIMDEPTSALDVVAQRSLMFQIKGLQDRLGFAVVFVTHDVSLVRQFSDRLMVMYAGQLAELGTTEQVFDTPKHPYSRGLLEAFPSIRGPKVHLAGIPGAPPGLASPPSGCRFHPRCPVALDRCATTVPELVERDGTLVRCLRFAAAPAGGGPPASGTEPFVPMPSPVPSAPVPSAPVPSAPVPSSVPAPSGAPAPAGGVEGGATAPLLDVEHLTMHFKMGGPFSQHKLHAVDDVSFSIGQREIVALVGESGSGKSTIVRLLAMVYRPTAGQIRFGGRALADLRRRRERLAYRGEVPMVFQDPYSSINPAYRVGHAIMRALKLHRPELDSDARRREARRVMAAVGLMPPAAVLAKYPYELSGGQRQRVGFAQALALRPKLILADEPVSMLDVSIRVGLLNVMTKLREEEGVSILYVTHDLASARYVADRVLVMYAGHVVERGPTEQVLSSPQHPYTQLLLSAAPDPHATDGRDLVSAAADSGDVGEPPKVVDPAPGCRFAPRCPIAVEVCWKETPQLGEVAVHQDAACHVAIAAQRRAPAPVP
jgi:peptide/nickel transport system ATP-binding protein